MKQSIEFHRGLDAALLVLVLLAGCASTKNRAQKNTEVATTRMAAVEEIPTPPADAEIPEEDPSSEEEEREVVSADRPTTGLGQVRNALVNKWIKLYGHTDRSRFQRHLLRGEPYRRVVQEILKRNEIPPEIFYLALIESGYRSEASSNADAVGVWQFIEPTGQRYGLSVSGWIDERRDPIRATEAAAKYLKDLHNVFNSWELAFAAYNAGEGRILRAVMRGKSRDFWELVRKGVLPEETVDYVPKFIAAMVIGENPEKYGFDVSDTPDHPRLSIVEVPANTRLRDLAVASGIAPDTLIEFNRNFLKEMTPPFAGRVYRVWVPASQVTKVENGVASLASARGTMLSHASVNPYVNSGVDRALFGVRSSKRTSRRAPTGFAPLQAARFASRVRGQSAFSPPKLAPQSMSQSLALDGSVPHYVYAKKGDTLESVAHRNGVTLDQLKSLNQISGSRLLAGQGLQIPQRSRGIASKRKNARPIVYRVKKGDSLTTIADRFGVSVRKLQEQNSLRRETVYAGEVLKVNDRGI